MAVVVVAGWRLDYGLPAGEVFGGEPFGALVGDYEFGKHLQDIALLKRISQVAAAAHAPFLSAASANLFGFESFDDLSDVRDLAEIFRTRDYDKWKAFRESDDSRYVGLALPHILMRLPYGPDTVPVDSFHFDEKVDGKDPSKYLWGNAAYAMGVRLTEARPVVQPHPGLDQGGGLLGRDPSCRPGSGPVRHTPSSTGRPCELDESQPP